MDDHLEQLRQIIEIIPVVHVDVANLSHEETAPAIGEYSVEVKVKSLFARVCTEFTLANANGRVLEGDLEFPLPDGAVICGYAIDVNGVMVDGRVVEKEKARIAFENEVKKGIDPGLVEQVKGNVYRTRIYPIPAHGSRRIRVIYTTPVTTAANGDAALFLPMPQHKLSKRDVSISVEMPGAAAPILGGLGDRRFEQAQAVWQVESHETDVKPEDHLIVGLPALAPTSGCIEKCDGDIYFSASAFVEKVSSKTDIQIPQNWRILWDASGSRSAADIEAGIKVLSALPDNASYELYIFRNAVEDVQKYTAKSALIDAIKQTVFDGGTNLDSLSAIASQSFDGPTLIFSDGLDTFSGKLPEFASNTIGFVSGAKRDIAVLKRLCGGRVVNLGLPIDDVMKEILQPKPVVSAVHGPGLLNIEGLGLPAEGRVTVLGRMQSELDEISIILSDGREFTVKMDKARDGNAIASAWAARRIEELSANAEDNREELLALGRHFNIVSPVSSMIVFERLEQWLEYDIEPPESLKDIHEQWLKHHPSSAQKEAEKARKKEQWINELKGLWQARMDWWENPIPKTKFSKSGVFDDEDAPAGGLLGAVAAVGDAAMSMARNVRNAVSGAFGGARNSVPMAAAGGARRGARREPAREMMCEDAEVISCECCERSVERTMPDEPNPAPKGAQATISIKAWDPQTPYLTALKDAQKIFKDADSLFREYIKQRAKYSASPAFYLDCAGFFFKENMNALAIRILSNLSELKLEDTSLLRVYAWRLREAGELDESIRILRKIIKLRPDEAVSYRDLALTLTIRAKKNHSAADVTEALENFKKAAFDPWQRRDARWTSLVALEEFNALASWSEQQKWPDGAPQIPEIDSFYRKNLDTDLRIVLMWDADNTDIDLHVLEPSGEEVFYQHQRSQTGGLLSFDVTTGYGPEEFMHKSAPKGVYKIMTNYFASHQQSLTGPVTVTVTVFSNWARENETSQILSLRLEKAKDKVSVGSIEFK